METNFLFEQFKNKRIAIVGDVMLDAYLIGGVTRISPEAPVPIVGLSKKENRLGGAANVALNIVSLGAQAVICSVVGNDTEGGELIDLFEKEGVSADGINLRNNSIDFSEIFFCFKSFISSAKDLSVAVLLGIIR